jgi:hypothetical protein
LIYEFIKQIYTSITLSQGLPLSYVLTPRFGHTFSWFYLPLSFILLISIITVTGGIVTMVLGKRISNTPGGMVMGIIGYVTFFGFIAPFWLMRSIYDLLTGTRRAWRDGVKAVE